MSDSVIYRLTLECGHSRLSGPWDSGIGEDGRLRHMIGDITSCEICPTVSAHGMPASGMVVNRESRLRQVVNVEDVIAVAYREPDETLSAARDRQPRGSV